MLTRFSFFLLLLVLLCAAPVRASIVRGTVRDTTGAPVSMVTVSIAQTGRGTLTDDNGHYTFTLGRGTYTLVFHFIGFRDEQRTITVSDDEVTVDPVILHEAGAALRSVEVFADRRDVAKEVMKQASRAREAFADRVDRLHFMTYCKVSLTEEKRDTTAEADSLYEDRPNRERPLILHQRRLEESVSEVWYDGPDELRERILAFNDGSYDRPDFGQSVSLTLEVGEPEITPQQDIFRDPYLLQSDKAWLEWDLYRPLLDVQAVSDKKLLSPLAATAPLSYRFDLAMIFWKNEQKIYRIRVVPLFPADGLFEGTVDIADGTWALVAADLSITPGSLIYQESVRLYITYDEIEPGVYFPLERAVTYEVKQGRRMCYGTVRVEHSGVEVAPVFPARLFTQEVRVIEEAAYERDSSFWSVHRTQALTGLEERFLHRTDSLRNWYTSDEFLDGADSTYNALSVWDFLLTGVGYRSHRHKIGMYFDPLLLQVNPVGIGGYRHRLGGHVHKEFSNDHLLETEGQVDYGFRNGDIRGKVGVGWTYVPRRFVRTFVRYGDYYDMINTYASVGSIFSRSNYVRTRTYSVSQRMEVVNGLFAELTFEHSDQQPITGMAMDEWSGRVFGDVNAPISFDRYIKSELRLDLSYTIRQKYMIRRNKKVLLGSKYPKLVGVYRKGIPGLFGSEVDFDYLEIGAKQDAELGRWGTVQWSLLAGSFVNRTNLRVLEHRYFRGSDPFFFSDPVRSFQLLGPTLSTASAFYRGNYFHHLDGILLNKIPLLNRLKLTEAVGASFLVIPEQDFRHAELYAGVERKFRIRQEYFRLGVYACIADSNVAKTNFEFKIGINFYDSYRRKWSY